MTNEELSLKTKQFLAAALKNTMKTGGSVPLFTTASGKSIPKGKFVKY